MYRLPVEDVQHTIVKMTDNRNVFDIFHSSDTSEEYLDSDKDPEYEPE